MRSPTSSRIPATTALSNGLLLGARRAVQFIREIVDGRRTRVQLERVAPFQMPRQLLLAIEMAEHPGDQLFFDEDRVPSVGIDHVWRRFKDAPITVRAADLARADGMLEPAEHERL